MYAYWGWDTRKTQGEEEKMREKAKQNIVTEDQRGIRNNIRTTTFENVFFLAFHYVLLILHMQ